MTSPADSILPAVPGIQPVSPAQIPNVALVNPGETLRAVAPLDPDKHAQAVKFAEDSGGGMTPIGAFRLLDAATDGQRRTLLTPRPKGTFSPTLDKWLSEPDNAAVAQDDLEALGKIDEWSKAFGEDRSLWEEIKSSAAVGSHGTNAGIRHLMAAFGAGDIDENLHAIAGSNLRIQQEQMGQSKEIQEYMRLLSLDDGPSQYGTLDYMNPLKRIHEHRAMQGLGTLIHFASSPTGMAAQISQILGGAALEVGVGATAGLAGPVAGVAAYGVAGTLAETGREIERLIIKAGYDPSDYDSLRQAYSDSKLIQEAREAGARRGITIGLVNAFSGIVGARAGAAAATAVGARQKIAAVGTGVLQETGLEVIGEAAGQVAGGMSLEALRPEEALLEGIGSLGVSGAEVAVFGGPSYAIRKARQRVEKAAKAAEAVRLSEAVHGLSRAFAESKYGKRLPGRLRALTGALLAGTDPEAASAYTDLEVWNKHWLDQGIDPAVAAEEMAPGVGGQRYADAGKTGEVVMPLPAFVEATTRDQGLFGLMEDTAFSEDGMTISQSREALEEAGAVLEEEPESEALSDPQDPIGSAVNEVVKLFQEDLSEQRAVEEEIKDLDERIKLMGEPAAENLEGASILEGMRTQRAQAAAKLQLLTERKKAVAATKDIEAQFEQQLIKAGRTPKQAKLVATLQGSILRSISSRALVPVADLMDLAVRQVKGDKKAAKDMASLLQTAFHGSRDQPTASIYVDGTQRPTTNSEGQPIHPGGEEAIRNFWRWFGDSKVVDAQGRPLPVYHGSPVLGFEQFEKSAINKSDPDSQANGFFFSTSSGEADTAGRFPWGRPNAPQAETRMFYIAVQRLASRSDVSRAARDLPENWETVYPYARSSNDATRMALQASGFDGIEHVAVKRFDREAFVRDGVAAAGGYELRASDDGGVDLYSKSVGHITGYRNFDDAVEAVRHGTFIAFEPTQIKSATNNRGTFDPAHASILQQEARGAVLLPSEPGSRAYAIELYENANASTMIHELSHAWMDVIYALGSAEGAAPGIVELRDQMVKITGVTPEQYAASKDDLRAVYSKANAEGRQLTKEEKARVDEIVKPLETFAKQFEAYTREGKAPSKELQPAFAAFRAWMKRIYNGIRRLGVRINPDIRAFFDRLVASDEEIEMAREEMGAAILDPEILKALPEADRERVIAAARNADDTSKARLNRDVLASWQSQRDAVRGKAMVSAREEAADLVSKMPEVRAITDMQESRSEKFSRKAVAEEYGLESDRYRTLDEMGLLVDEGGLAPSQVAEAYTMSSGESLIDGIIIVRDRPVIIERLAAAIVRHNNPELLATPEVRKRAREYLVSEERVSLLLAERDALMAKAKSEASKAKKGETGKAKADKRLADEQRKRRGEVGQLKADEYLEERHRRAAFSGVEKIDVLRKMAANDVASMTYQQAQRLPQMFAAIGKEARKAKDLAKKADWPAAARAITRELYNLEKYRLAAKGVKKADKNVSRMKDFGRKTYQVRLGKGGKGELAQANSLLKKYLVAPFIRQHERKQMLGRWLDGLGANSPAISTWIVGGMDVEPEGQHWRTLTLEQIQDLRNGMEQIYKHAQDARELYTSKVREGRVVASMEVIASVEKHKKTKLKRPYQYKPNKFLRAAAGIRPIDSLAHQMDGLEAGGSVWHHLVRGPSEAQTAEVSETALYNKEYRRIMHMRTNEDRREWSRRTLEVSRSRVLSLNQRIHFAMYYSSKEGRQRLSQQFTKADIAKVLGSLNQRHADIASAMHKMQEVYWPLLSAQQERVHGIAPPKVEVLPFDTVGPDGAKIHWDGGYTRLYYTNSPRTFHMGVEEMAVELSKGRPAREVMMAGSMHERVDVLPGAELDLNTGLVLSNVAEMVHVITHKEAMLDAFSILYDKDVRQAIIDHRGQETFDEFVVQYRALAAGHVAALDAMEEIMQYLRAGVIVQRIGTRLTTLLINLSGAAQSIGRMSLGELQSLVAAHVKLMRQPKMALKIVKHIHAADPAMRNRALTLDRDAYSVQRNVGITRLTEARDKITYGSFLPLTVTQMMVDIPFYLGAFMHAGGNVDALIEGKDVSGYKDAMAIAYQSVVAAQGGGRIIDMARVQQGSGWKKLWTTFMGFGIRTVNSTIEAGARVKQDPKSVGAYGRFAWTMLWFYGIPALWTMMIYRLFRGDTRDEDEPLEQWVRQMVAQAMSGIPIVREGQGAVLGINDYEGPVGSSAITSALDVVTQSVQAFRDGEIDDAFIRSYLELGGVLTHLPTAQFIESMRGVEAAMKGDTSWIQGLTVGAPRK